MINVRSTLDFGRLLAGLGAGLTKRAVTQVRALGGGPQYRQRRHPAAIVAGMMTSKTFRQRFKDLGIYGRAHPIAACYPEDVFAALKRRPEGDDSKRIALAVIDPLAPQGVWLAAVEMEQPR